MTLGTTPPVIDYVENGVTLAHAVPFQFEASTDLICSRITAGVETVLTVGVDYTVTGGAGLPGTVNKTNGGVVGTIFRIKRFTSRAQPTDYTPGDAFPAETHEDALDRLAAVNQEQDIDVGDLESRALRLPAGELAPELASAATRRNALLGFADSPSAPPELLDKSLFKGPPGSAGEAFIDRAQMAAFAASNLDDGYLAEKPREGKFIFYTAAGYVARFGGQVTLVQAVAADPLQGVHVPAAADPTGAAGAWVRVTDVLNPFMFGGATNYATGSRSTMVPPYGESQTPGAIDGVLVDARAACRACLDVADLHKGRFEVDYLYGRAIWGITSTDGTANTDGLTINRHSEYPFRINGGEFRGIGAGRRIINADEAGYSRLTGLWHVRSGADLGSSFGYNIRQWENGLWVRNSSQSGWDFFKTSGFLRWGIEFDAEFNLLDYNNNIAARFGQVYGNNNGSACDRAGLVFQIAWTAANNSGAAGSFAQRTNLTLAAGHEILRPNDIVRAPGGTYHQIMEKVGNVISVSPWFLGAVPAAGTLTSCHGGAMRAPGRDVAGAGADNLTSVNCGSTVDFSNSLHGTYWGQIIQEGGGLALICGTPNGINIGHSIAHMHSESNTLDLLSIGGQVELSINAFSAWAAQDYANPWKLCEQIFPNDGVSNARNIGLGNVGIFINGQWWCTGSMSPLYGTVGTKSRNLGGFATILSNNPGENNICSVQAAGVAYNITLRYHETTDRMQKQSFIAALDVVGAGGVAPTDTITVTIDAPDFGAGIQFANGTTTQTYVINGGTATGPIRLLFLLDTNGATLRWVVVPLKGVRDAIMDVTTEYRVSGTKVVAARQAGFAADGGTAEGGAHATYAAAADLVFGAAYSQAEHTALINRLHAVELALQGATRGQKALKDALLAHGLVGA